MKNVKVICEAVDKNRDQMLEAERYIWKHPESGFREWNTTEYLVEKYKELGYALHMAGDIPGFYTDIDTGRPGPGILVLGELDSLIIPEHPEADPVTGAVHACGHHAQSAALYGLACALKEPGILEELCGTIRLCAVPAEELIEISYREELIEKGTLHYLTGKAEYLHRGYFDGMDIAFMFHTAGKEIGDIDLFSMGGYNGSVSKRLIFRGKAAHAASGASMGVNVLHASVQAITAINSIRDTFGDNARVHYVMSDSAQGVNTVPDRAGLEMMVRESTTEAVISVNEKVNRASAASAAILGAQLHISDKPAYAALRNDIGLVELAERALKDLKPDAKTGRFPGVAAASTDMGFLSLFMPAIQPLLRGGDGIMHGTDFCIRDKEAAVVTSAKLQLHMLNILLSDDGKEARKIIENYKAPCASKEEALNLLEKMNLEKDAVIFNEDGTIHLDFRG